MLAFSLLRLAVSYGNEPARECTGPALIAKTGSRLSDDGDPHDDDADDVWAWIVIGLIAAGVMLAIWLPMLKVMLQA